jgi:hypothetical protein
MLILDATDHRLLQNFLNVEPNKSPVRRHVVICINAIHAFSHLHLFQIISRKRIWQTTMKRMMIEEEIALLEHRLTSTQSQSTSNLLGHMLDDIDRRLTSLIETMETSASTCTLPKEI